MLAYEGNSLNKTCAYSVNVPLNNWTHSILIINAFNRSHYRNKQNSAESVAVVIPLILYFHGKTIFVSTMEIIKIVCHYFL